MVIAEQGNRVEICCLEVLPPELPSAGDLRLSVQVISHGFAGERTGVWVEAPAFASFLEQLRVLETRRQGAAEVEGMTSGDFRLRIQAVDQSGHMSVEGRLGRAVAAQESRATLFHTVEFGFEFCPSRLPLILADFERLPSAQP